MSRKPTSHPSEFDPYSKIPDRRRPRAGSAPRWLHGRAGRPRRRSHGRSRRGSGRARGRRSHRRGSQRSVRLTARSRSLSRHPVARRGWSRERWFLQSSLWSAFGILWRRASLNLYGMDGPVQQTGHRLGDVLDAHSGLGRQGHRSVPHTIAQLLGERGVVEDADTSGIQESASSPRRSRSPGLSR
jgi:hypothetical protein